MVCTHLFFTCYLFRVICSYVLCTRDFLQLPFHIYSIAKNNTHIQWIITKLNINILAASPLASSGFAAIENIYILMTFILILQKIFQKKNPLLFVNPTHSVSIMISPFFNFDDFYINFAKKIFQNIWKILQFFANITHSVLIIISPLCNFQTSK